MTMQNHMPWTEPNPVTISANYVGFSDADNQTLSNYVRMLHHTDIATKDFLAQLSKINKRLQLFLRRSFTRALSTVSFQK